MKSRSQIRENALQFLYLLSYQAEDSERQKTMFVERENLTGEELAFFELLVDGVMAHQAELDEIIAGRLVDWRLERLPFLDLNILRIAVFELNFREDLPTAVAISEAVNLAKKYCDDKAAPYINGVLGKLADGRKDG